MLPLSFLVRTNNTENNRKWLKDMGNTLISLQQDSYFGAIEEKYGNLAYGNARPPESNAQYGTTEAPLGMYVS